MVSEALKINFIPKEETRCFLQHEAYPASQCPPSRFKFCLWILPFLVLVFSAFVFSFYAVLKLQTLREEVDLLRKEVEKLQVGLVDDELFDDIRRFEGDDIYTDDVGEDHSSPPWVVNEGDDLDMDYDLNYDDDEEPAENVRRLADKILKNKNNELSPDHEDLTNLMKGGSITKVGQETKRTRRDVIASTFEGVPINAESYADTKKKNKTLGKARRVDGVSKHDNSYHSTAWSSKYPTTYGIAHYEQPEVKNPTPPPAPIASRPSRVMHVESKPKAYRRAVKRPQLRSAGHSWSVPAEQRTGNRYRHSGEDRAVRGRMLPAIHFSGDTSKYILGTHTNFGGNGRLQHLDPTFVDWIPDEWVQRLGMDQYFQMNRGNLTIRESGLYLVYAQIYFYDSHDTNSFKVCKNGQMLLQCTTMTHINNATERSNTCFTAGLHYFDENDQVNVQDMSYHRISLFTVGRSFFGLAKLWDIPVKLQSRDY